MMSSSSKPTFSFDNNETFLQETYKVKPLNCTHEHLDYSFSTNEKCPECYFYLVKEHYRVCIDCNFGICRQCLKVKGKEFPEPQPKPKLATKIDYPDVIRNLNFLIQKMRDEISHLKEENERLSADLEESLATIAGLPYFKGKGKGKIDE